MDSMIIKQPCLVVLLFWLASIGWAQDTQASPRVSPLLIGGVEHSEFLSVVDKKFRPGKLLLESQLPKFDKPTNGRWYRIPNWMAGRSWSSEKQTMFYRENCKTGEIDTSQRTMTYRGTETFGWQRDANGDIWQYDSAPFVKRLEEEGAYRVQITVESDEPISCEDNKFVWRSKSTQI